MYNISTCRKTGRCFFCVWHEYLRKCPLLGNSGQMQISRDPGAGEYTALNAFGGEERQWERKPFL